jgi:glucosamine--fructose-6-phosphate aminotransferase (isomerizing)
MVTQSGETFDLIKLLKLTNKKGIFTMGVCNVVGSTIARETQCGLFCNSGKEVSIAATKTFSSQLVALSLIALWISHKKGRDELL